MKKSHQIREAMRGAGKLKQAQVLEKSGVDKTAVSSFLYQGALRGEVTRTGAEGDYDFELVETYQSRQGQRGAGAAKKKPPKKKRAPRADRQKLRAITEKARAALAPTAHELAVESYRHVGRSLRDYLRTAVDGVDGDQILCMLIDSHERAEKLVDATMGRT